MAKSTKAVGDSYTEHELSDPHPPVRITRAMLGGDQPSVGTDSSEPSSNESQSGEHGTVSPQEDVLTTENPSDLTDEEDSTVLSMDGNGQETETESSEDEEVPPYSEWDYRELQAECKERGLSATGSTEELIKRLEDFDSEQWAESDESDEDDFS